MVGTRTKWVNKACNQGGDGGAGYEQWDRELDVEVDMVTRTGNKANLVLVAGRIVGDRQGGVVGAKAAVRRLQGSGLLWARPGSTTQGDWWKNLCTDSVQDSVVSSVVLS